MHTEWRVALAAYGLTHDPTTDPEVLAELSTGVLDDLERDITGMLEGLVGTDRESAAARCDGRAVLGAIRAERSAR